MFQTGVCFFCKCSRETGVLVWRKLCFRQHFGFLFSILFFCKDTKGDRGEGRVVGSLSFDVKVWKVSLNLDPFGQIEKGGREGGLQKWGLFLGYHKCMVRKCTVM